MTHDGARVHLDVDSEPGAGGRKLLSPGEFELAGQGVEIRSAKLWFQPRPIFALSDNSCHLTHSLAGLAKLCLKTPSAKLWVKRDPRQDVPISQKRTGSHGQPLG